MRKLALATAAVLVAGTAFCAEETRWLNLHVVEADEGTEVNLHVPLSMVTTILSAAKSDDLQNGKLKVRIESGSEIDWPRIVAELKSAQEGEYLKVKKRDADVSFVKRDGMVRIDVDERGPRAEHVEIRLPQELLEAFSVDSEGRIDLRALLERLDRAEVGDLVRVKSADADVRIWLEVE